MSALDSLRLDPVDTDHVKIGSKAARVEDAPDKATLKNETELLLKKLGDLQQAFYADGRHALLLILQGRDASGKDSVIKTVMGAVNPLGVRIAQFGPPTDEELAHDYLWRVHHVIPPRRMIGVFNRSHYEDVLVVRVRELVKESVWKQRYDQINAFEKTLSQNNVVIRKCFLHVSRDEQLVRLRERLDDPMKNWKFRLGDLDDRARWDDYTDAYKDVLTKCSTKHAPWYVVPADEKTVRNYLVAKMLVETLEELKPKFPAMDAATREAAMEAFGKQQG
jgi:PPK2 family polyphosphate:nucleotide phosphotransferase